MASSTGGRVARTVILVLVILALVAAAAEIGARMYAGKVVADEFRAMHAEQGVEVQETPDVSFGSSSVVLGYLTGGIGRVDIDSPSTLQVENPAAEGGAPVVRGTPAADVRITGLDLSDQSNPTAAAAGVRVMLPDELLQASANQEILARPAEGPLAQALVGAARVTGLHADPGRDVLVAEFAGGLVTVDFRPRAQAGDAVVDVQGGSIAGIAVDGFIQRVADQAIRGPIADLGETMSIDSFEVVDGGVVVNLSGENVTAADLERLSQDAA
ncbi:LmeA family phospholipid-binding protein [Corynebacterium sp. 335C]